MTTDDIGYTDSFGRPKERIEGVAEPEPRVQEHFIHGDRDSIPIIEQWQKDLWRKGHVNQVGEYIVHDPIWREQVEENSHISEGFWVIVSEMR